MRRSFALSLTADHTAGKYTTPIGRAPLASGEQAIASRREGEAPAVLRRFNPGGRSFPALTGGAVAPRASAMLQCSIDSVGVELTFVQGSAFVADWNRQ